MRSLGRASGVLILLALAVAPVGAQTPGTAPRIFISVDMEGVAGVVSGDQLSTGAFEYERFRGLMTEEASAAIAAARAAGAGEIVVADSHGTMQNLLVERLPADIQLVRGAPRPLGMMQGIDASFAGVIFIGYHAGTTNPQGVRAHSFSSATLADLRLDGVSVTEGAWNAALAAHFGVPVLAVSGDEAAVQEVASLVPGVETAVVKWPYGFHAARTLMPQAARDVIARAVRRGMERRATIVPQRAKTPVELEIRFKNYRPSEVLSWLRGVRRIDAHAVAYTAADMVEAARFLQFALNYQAALEP
jgi:D-amino peptidase